MANSIPTEQLMQILETPPNVLLAAPDLLAALKQLTRFCVRPNDDDRHDDGYDLGMRMARAAIAKAEGK